MAKNENKGVYYTKKEIKDQLEGMIDSYLETRPKILNG